MQIPPRYWDKALIQNALANEALIALKNGQSIFLTGSCGSGKTHLAVALMTEWFAGNLGLDRAGQICPTKGVPIFLPAAELLLEIKESWRMEKNLMAESEKDLLDRYTRTPLLVIDDLGAEKVSDWSRQTFYLLIDRRYRNLKQTVITSNLTHDQLSGQLDDRIASRICEMGAVIDMGRRDWRVR